jgi:hypothetical protein
MLPFPETVSDAEFEAIVQRHFAGKSPAAAPNLTAVMGPSGAGKTHHTYALAARSDYQNHITLDYNEGMLCQLTGYQKDVACGASLDEAREKYTPAAVFFIDLLLDAGMGAANSVLQNKFELSSGRTDILRKYAAPKPYNILLCSTLRIPDRARNAEGDTWAHAPAFGYGRTLHILYADLADCLARISHREETSALRWKIAGDNARKTARHEECMQAIPYRMKELGETGDSFHFGLPQGQTAPMAMAEKLMGKPLRVINQALWQHFYPPGQNFTFGL